MWVGIPGWALATKIESGKAVIGLWQSSLAQRERAREFGARELLNRLSRDTLTEQMGLFIGLINAGLTVVTLADGQSYGKTTIDSDFSKLMLSLMGKLALRPSMTYSVALSSCDPTCES